MIKPVQLFALFLLSILAGTPPVAQAQNEEGKNHGARRMPDLTNVPHIDSLFVQLKPEAQEPHDRDRVHYGAAEPPDRVILMSQRQAKALSIAAGVKLKPIESILPGNHLLALPRRMTRAEADAIARLLEKHPDVQFASPNGRYFIQQTPNDPSYGPQQWNFKGPPGGLNLPGAWDVTTGSNDVVIAVIDNGVLAHSELSARLLPGYDFISDPATANDGDGRDGFPTDPGDWVTQAEVDAGGQFAMCQEDVGNSSWHGTHVAGTIGAASNNGVGVAGVNWGSPILPIRALGKCGGARPDILAGVLWAAGMPVPGVATNPNPTKIINLSIAAREPCDPQWQAVIDSIRVTFPQTVFIAAAGNKSENASNASPASCNHVIAVAATTRQGALAAYSNTGGPVAISAPGGDAASGVYSTGDQGTQAPLNDNTYKYQVGTSQAAPHVAGIVSLMRSVKPLLRPGEIKTMLRTTARPFPTGTGNDCTTALCGAGIVDGARAVSAAKTSVSAGRYHTVAMQADGSVWAWGYGYYGILGDGTTSGFRATPGRVPGLPPVKDVEAGHWHTLALAADGTVWGWGLANFGQLDGNTSPANGGTGSDQYATPIKVPGIGSMVAVSGGSRHSLALANDGTVWAWGGNAAGQVGVPIIHQVDHSKSPPPIEPYAAHIAGPLRVPGLSGIVAVAAGIEYSLALGSDGAVWVWGADYSTSLVKTDDNRHIPVREPGLSDVIAISASGFMPLALKSDGTVWAWGRYAANATNGNSSYAQQVSGVDNANMVAIAGGYVPDQGYLNVALKADGTVWTWGAAAGSLGNGETVGRDTPGMVAGLSGVYGISASGAHVMALQSDYSIQAWGQNQQGQLGIGSASAGNPTPVQVHGENNIGLFASANPPTAESDPGPIAGGDGGDIPTLPEWGAMIMGSLLLMSMYSSQRRRQR